MRINPIKTGGSVWRAKFHDLARRKSASLMIITATTVLAGILLIFTSTFRYGIHLYESGQSRYFKYLSESFKELAKFDFTGLQNYATSHFTAIDDMKLDIKFKHLQRIHYLRDLALQEKYIASELKDEEFPAKLTYNGQEENIKISLTGKISRTHLGDPNKWSYEVKARGDATIAGMKRFGILVPPSRGFLTDWIAVELMKELDLIGIRIDFVNFSINGKPYGIYYLEERFDKHLIENNRLREGLIFKLEKEIQPYQEAKVMANPEKRAQLLLLKRLWHQVSTGELPANRFFDMKKLAKLFVVTDLMNIGHPLNKENLRFYFNPVTGLVEPIAREFDNLDNNELSQVKVFLDKPVPLTSHFWHKSEAIISLIYNDLSFQEAYAEQASTVTQREFLNEFFTKRKDQIDLISSKLHQYWPYYSLPENVLYENQRILAERILPEIGEVEAALIQRQSSVILEVHNNHCLPIEVTGLTWAEGRGHTLSEPFIVEPGKITSSEVTPRVLNSIRAGDLNSNANISFNLLGIPSQELKSNLDFSKAGTHPVSLAGR